MCSSQPRSFITIGALAETLGVTVDMTKQLTLTLVRSESLEVVARAPADHDSRVEVREPRGVSMTSSAPTKPAVLLEHPLRPSRFASTPLLRRIEELDNPGCVPERAFRVATAHIVLADVPLILHDFPHLRSLAPTENHRRRDEAVELGYDDATKRRVEQWLLANGALISETQLKSNSVNTPIRAIGEAVPVHRPPAMAALWWRRSRIMP